MPEGSKSVLFCTLGSRGDVHPYVAVARALIARGVGATIATGEEHRETITRAGVGYTLVPPSKSDFDTTVTTMAQVMHATKGGEYIYKEIVVPWLERTHEATLAAARDGGHDVIVGHPLAFCAPMVAEQLGLPYVYTVLQPMILFSAYDPTVIPPLPWFDVFRPLRPWPYWLLMRFARVATWSWGRPVKALRKKVGLPRDPRHPLLGGLVSRTLNLAMFSPLLAEPQRDWPEKTVATGACLFDDPQAGGASAELERFLGLGGAHDKPILFTLGSAAVEVVGEGPRFFAAALEAARLLGRRCVLLTGKGEAPEGCDGVRALAVGYAPFSTLMPRCAAIVHQCGAGTTAEAMRAGVPQVCVPFAHDQPDNAARLVRRGVARIVKRKRVSAKRLAAALGHVMDARHGCPERAARLGEAARREDGAATAAEAIIGVLRSGARWA